MHMPVNSTFVSFFLLTPCPFHCLCGAIECHVSDAFLCCYLEMISVYKPIFRLLTSALVFILWTEEVGETFLLPGSLCNIIYGTFIYLIMN